MQQRRSGRAAPDAPPLWSPLPMPDPAASPARHTDSGLLAGPAQKCDITCPQQQDSGQISSLDTAQMSRAQAAACMSVNAATEAPVIMHTAGCRALRFIVCRARTDLLLGSACGGLRLRAQHPRLGVGARLALGTPALVRCLSRRRLLACSLLQALHSEPAGPLSMGFRYSGDEEYAPACTAPCMCWQGNGVRAGEFWLSTVRKDDPDQRQRHSSTAPAIMHQTGCHEAAPEAPL